MFKRSSLLLTLALLCVLGQTVTSHADEPKTGEKRDTLLYIRTVPPGAKVLLDGKELGKSDDIFAVEPGVGRIVVELEGYQSDPRQVTIKANAVTRLELTLKQQGEAGVAAKAPGVDEKARTTASVGHLTEGPVERVSITTGVKYFRQGDSITITEVNATSPDLKWGDKVIVKGHYTLASEPKARLCLFATTKQASGPTPIRPGQTTDITKGEGTFELFETLDCDGYLHVTFYSEPGDRPLGGLYFGTAKQMKEIEDWDVQSRYTATEQQPDVSVRSPDAPTSPAREQATKPQADAEQTDKVVEGIGWGKIRVGATREALAAAFGPLEPTPGGQRMGWSSRLHIDFWFAQDGRAVEVRFVKGFSQPLTSGIKIGSSENDVLSAYGTPNRVMNEPKSKMIEYDNRGVLMWITDGEVESFTVFKPREAATQPAPAANAEPEAPKAKIIEGVGFGDVCVGATREEVFKALGKPDNDPSSKWPNWARHHLECGFDKGTGKLHEMHLNPGFQGVLANGIELGSPENTLVELYGKPEKMIENSEAKRLTYATKGILFWTFQGKVSQIVVFKPHPGPEPAAAKDDRPAASDAAAEHK